MSGLDDVRRDWERHGTDDPLWGVLSHRDKRGGAWEIEDFFRTGKQFINELWPSVEHYLPSLRMQDALDFGCGVGRLTQPLAARFENVVGVDVSSAMLEQANELNDRHNIQFVHNTRGDLRTFPDESFDFVLSFIVLQHLPKQLIYAYVAAFYRVLRPGGGVFFSLPSAPRFTTVGLVYRLVPQRVLLTAIRARRGAAMRMSYVPVESMRGFLGDTGFDVRAVVDSPSAGRHWKAESYFASKPPGT